MNSQKHRNLHIPSPPDLIVQAQSLLMKAQQKGFLHLNPIELQELKVPPQRVKEGKAPELLRSDCASNKANIKIPFSKSQFDRATASLRTDEMPEVEITLPEFPNKAGQLFNFEPNIYADESKHAHVKKPISKVEHQKRSKSNKIKFLMTKKIPYSREELKHYIMQQKEKRRKEELERQKFEETAKIERHRKLMELEKKQRELAPKKKKKREKENVLYNNADSNCVQHNSVSSLKNSTRDPRRILQSKPNASKHHYNGLKSHVNDKAAVPVPLVPLYVNKFNREVDLLIPKLKNTIECVKRHGDALVEEIQALQNSCASKFEFDLKNAPIYYSSNRQDESSDGTCGCASCIDQQSYATTHSDKKSILNTSRDEEPAAEFGKTSVPKCFISNSGAHPHSIKVCKQRYIAPCSSKLDVNENLEQERESAEIHGQMTLLKGEILRKKENADLRMLDLKEKAAQTSANSFSAKQWARRREMIKNDYRSQQKETVSRRRLPEHSKKQTRAQFNGKAEKKNPFKGKASENRRDSLDYIQSNLIGPWADSLDEDLSPAHETRYPDNDAEACISTENRITHTMPDSRDEIKHRPESLQKRISAYGHELLDVFAKMIPNLKFCNREKQIELCHMFDEMKRQVQSAIKNSAKINAGGNKTEMAIRRSIDFANSATQKLENEILLSRQGSSVKNEWDNASLPSSIWSSSDCLCRGESYRQITDNIYPDKKSCIDYHSSETENTAHSRNDVEESLVEESVEAVKGVAASATDDSNGFDNENNNNGTQIRQQCTLPKTQFQQVDNSNACTVEESEERIPSLVVQQKIDEAPFIDYGSRPLISNPEWVSFVVKLCVKFYYEANGKTKTAAGIYELLIKRLSQTDETSESALKLLLDLALTVIKDIESNPFTTPCVPSCSRRLVNKRYHFFPTSGDLLEQKSLFVLNEVLKLLRFNEKFETNTGDRSLGPQRVCEIAKMDIMNDFKNIADRWDDYAVLEYMMESSSEIAKEVLNECLDEIARKIQI